MESTSSLVFDPMTELAKKMRLPFLIHLSTVEKYWK